MMFEACENREAASLAAADRLEAGLRRRLEGGGRASLVVSGGTTPAACLRMLAARGLDWERVHVTLSDERWLPASEADSNERLVRETLLVGPAARASFFPLYRHDQPVEGACADLNTALRELPFPFAGVLLGMGADGHFASLFPDAPNLGEGLTVDGPDLCLPVTTAASPHPRISLTLAALTRSDEITLLFFGKEKRRVFDEAVASAGRYPVSSLLRQKRAPVRALWAP